MYVLADEIYKDILYTGAHHSIAAFPEMAQRTIILDGFSKSYAMTGWRLGLWHYAGGTCAPYHPFGGKQRFLRRHL